MWTEEKLDTLLTEPSQALIEDVKKIKGDIMVLGAGGKMGPTLCLLAKKAIEKAGIEKRVIAVKKVAIRASKTPARISFPIGAGKCPIA